MQRSAKGVTILLIEDDEVDVMGMRRAFENTRICSNLVVASDGLDALKKLRDGTSVPRPYIVLLDLNMPRMNGLEFLDAVRQDPDTRHAVIFVLTTSTSEEDRMRAYNRNVAGYIVKRVGSDNMADMAGLLEKYLNVNTFPEGG